MARNICSTLSMSRFWLSCSCVKSASFIGSTYADGRCIQCSQEPVCVAAGTVATYLDSGRGLHLGNERLQHALEKEVALDVKIDAHQLDPDRHPSEQRRRRATLYGGGQHSRVDTLESGAKET